MISGLGLPKVHYPKSVSKTVISKTQWEIMASSGVPDALIPKFQDADFWLSYFPPLAMEDLKRFGLAVDWRRSFITTQKNPYYDLFIRWQFNTLKKRDRVKFGMRPTIFSLIDRQPCADHDRATGEGVGPQEYTLIKLQVNTVKPNWTNIINSRKLFLVAATLRPETMYGQTNCFVLPEGEYGFYLAFDAHTTVTKTDKHGVLRQIMTRETALDTCDSVFVCSKRSADNMGVQGLIPLEESKGDLIPICLHTVTGTDLIGLPLSAPNAKYDSIYALPMLGISMQKGTGIVTSVPSDAPDDFAALRDLQEKPAFREKYGVTENMVNYDLVEIIEIPGLGRRAAVDLCLSKKVKSQNDKVILAEIKEEVYKKGFYEGIMLVGAYKGLKVSEAKIKSREELFASGKALNYYEPEKRVISRSGDDCVVALCNQWYLDYGETNWKSAIEEYIHSIDNFNTYSARCLHQFSHVVGWLKEWACSRHYGLGTYIPWELEAGNKTLIESLSDSTIYMAYYTIAHLLQGDVSGSKPGSLGLLPSQLTDEVLDFIFMQTDDFPLSTNIPKIKLNKLRNEFSYWYPMDLRVSGKDLIFNHLTMALYNHAAIWPSMSKTKWPKSFFCNGHVLVDAEKMSKSAGNFLTLEEAIESFSADATRIGLADAGDSLDDANFQKENGVSALMRLFLLDNFVEETLSSTDLRSGEKLWIDLVFENEIIGLVHQGKQAFDKMQFRDALKYTFFDFSSIRDQYRHFCGPTGMHKDSIGFWIETQAVILSPIAPHVAEYIWSVRMQKPHLVVNAQWPTFSDRKEYDVLLHRQYYYISSCLEEFRKTREKSVISGKSGKNKNRTANTSLPPPTQCDNAVIYVAKEYLPWQQNVLRLLQTLPLDSSMRKPQDPNFIATIRCDPAFSSLDPKLAKSALSFASFRIKEELSIRGPDALELQMPFNEQELLNESSNLVQRVLGLKQVEIRCSSNRHPKDTTDRLSLAVPSKPSIVFLHSVE